MNRAGTTYYFCSVECLNQFDANLHAVERLIQTGVQIGTIAEVHGPVVDVVCDRLPPLHQALFARIDHEAYVLEVHQHLDERRLRAVTFNRTAGLRRGMAVFAITGR